jgi:hypothetical protein
MGVYDQEPLPRKGMTLGDPRVRAMATGQRQDDKRESVRVVDGSGTCKASGSALR